jgi:hypothetical protein
LFFHFRWQCLQRDHDRRHWRAGKLYNMRIYRGLQVKRLIPFAISISMGISTDLWNSRRGFSVLTPCYSNYWTAAMYFKHENGSYKRVPIYPNAQLGYEGQNAEDIKGGMTIYYTQKDFDGPGDQHITAFQPGFRMTVGNPTVDSINGTKNGLRYTCLQTILTRGSETPDFPKEPCPAGIMAIHHFPSCWDGKNLDSPDHQSHMFSTTRGGFREAGPCPASHPVRMPQLAYETMWNTTAFKDMWPKDGSQPFVWSYSDSKGYVPVHSMCDYNTARCCRRNQLLKTCSRYGTHADYVFGWKGDSLQRAMNDTCMCKCQCIHE